MNRFARRACAVAFALIAGYGCAAKRHEGDVLAARVSDLMPHGDRDHFVYLSERTVDGKLLEPALTVDHVSAPTAQEFTVTESSNGVAVGDSRWLVDDRGISLLSEEVEGLGVRLAYDPPLLLYPQPLLVGEHRASATGAATRLDDGESVGSVTASVVVRSSATRSRHPLAGNGNAVALQVTRSLEGPSGALVIHIDSVNKEGVGEIQSVAALEGVPMVIKRSLVCGFIQGKAVGRCDELKP